MMLEIIGLIKTYNKQINKNKYDTTNRFVSIIYIPYYSINLQRKGTNNSGYKQHTGRTTIQSGQMTCGAQPAML